MNDINFELYKTFYYIACEKNLTRAANKMFISQPAITQIIKKLEQQIGYSLFYRTKKGMELTNEGQILFDYVKIPIECLLTSKEHIIKIVEKKYTKIRIGSGTTLIKNILTNTIELFKEKYPEIKIEIEHNSSMESLTKLDNNLLDVVILYLPQHKSDNIEFLPIQTINDSFIANTAKFKDYQNKVYTLNDLSHFPLILQAEVSSSRQHLNNFCKKNHIKLNAEYELDSYGLVLDFVMAGLGIGLINRNYVEKELSTNKLFEIKTDYNIPSRQVGVAINKKNKANKILIQFIEYLKNNK